MNTPHNQHETPIRSLMANHLTLASLNARQSESPTLDTPFLYLDPWDNEAAFLATPTNNPYDFQSNSIFEHMSTTQLPTVNTPGLAGLGIHCPDTNQGYNLFSPKPYTSELADQYFSISPRLESSYSMKEPGIDLSSFDDLTHVFQPDTTSFWPLSTSSISTEYLKLGGLDPLSLSGPPGTCLSPSESSHDDLSIESLSAAAGLTIEEFTTKITEGAQNALKQLAELEQFSDGTTSTGNPSTSSHDMYFDNISTLDPLAPLSDLSGIPSPEMWFQHGCLGVNPAEIMPPPPLSSTGLGVEDVFNEHLGHQVDLEDIFPEFRLPPAFCPIPPISMSGISAPTRSSRNISEHNPVPNRDDADQVSDYEPPAFLSASSSEYSPSFGSTRQFQARSTRLRKRKVTQIETMESRPPVASSSCHDAIGHLPPINLGSPVFDAHRGIELEDLKARAERYRLRNQGREYDKRWLLSFAGKLSSKGELIEEFRCYVVGCQQVNKRRDHILIHVGAHLDQRPFKCVHWFLRKNECKRHELSHTGIRPFTCNICPYPGTTFVRQDLLRRHMKRTHQMEDDKENKGVSGTFRPRKKMKNL